MAKARSHVDDLRGASRLAVEGTLAELKDAAGRGSSTLEDVFLSLTLESAAAQTTSEPAAP